MNRSNRGVFAACCGLVMTAIGACEKQNAPPPAATPTTAKPASAPAGTPAAAPPSSPATPPANAAKNEPASAGASVAGNRLELEGLVLIIPAEWTADTITPGPLAPKAAFKLPKAEGDTQDGSVRISHYASMKGKDDANIDRWVSQVKRADGTQAKREDAKITVKELGSIRVTLFDITGTVGGSMDGSGAGGMANQRMLNAIIDHPRGPHYLRATGGTATITRWQAALEACALGAVVP